MGVGDGFEQAVEDQMGGGGGGGGGVGVEAAAVVVITLLAVLGNAMVVATLVRRSLLHHPSNRLVLSLTGSNLILTVVVLPGMVTSLLMTPGSPSNQQPTLSHHFNNSGLQPSQDSVESISTFDNLDDSSALLQQSNVSVISSHFLNSSTSLLKSQSGGPSRMSQQGINSSMPLGSYSDDALTFSPFQNNPEVTSSVPEYFTTKLPLYLEVSSGMMNPPVSLYNHRDVSVLSQELEDSEPPWRHSTANLQNSQQGLSRPKSMETEDLDLTFPKDQFPESDGNQRIKLEGTNRDDESVAKDAITKRKDNEDDLKPRTDGKEIRSLSVFDRKIKSLRDRESNPNLQEEREVESFTITERKVSQPHTNYQPSKSKSKHRERSNVAHQDVYLESEGGVSDTDKLQQEVHQESSHVLDTVQSTDRLEELEERVKHTSPRRRKQGMRHYQHRKQRLRRNRDADDGGSIHLTENSNKQHVVHDRQIKLDDVNDNNTKEPMRRGERRTFTGEDNLQEEEDIRRTEERRFKREQGDLPHGSDRVNIQEKVQVRIKQQDGEGEHVILVRGVQEIEEQQEKQMVVVVLDQEEPNMQHREPHQHIQVKVEQHLENVRKRDHESLSSTKEDHKSIDNEQDGFSDQLPKLSVLDPKSAKHLQKHEDQPKHNHTFPEDIVEDEDDHLLGVYAQLQHVSSRELELQSQETMEHHQTVDENEVDEVQQIYTGVEWESDRWEGGRILCQGAAFFTNLVTAASALTVAVIAIDRYLAIVRPLVYGVMVTSGRCLLMLIWCWSQALLTALPPLLGWARYERREPYGRCGVAWGDSPSYTAVWTISVFLIPFSIMVVCYYHILQVARNKCRRIRVGKMSESSPPNTPDPTISCLDGFPFPLSVAHLTSPPIGSKPASGIPSSPVLRKLSSFGNLSGPHLGNQVHHPEHITSRHWNGSGPSLVRNMTTNGGVEARLERGIPCRSYSVSGMLRAIDSSTNTNDSTIKPKRKLGDFGRSRSLCQVPQQPPRPCLRRVQSTFSVRHTLKKLSLGTRRASWNWEGSPSKGFWTVFVVMGAHLLTWGPYTCMAIAEAILGRERLLLLPYWVMVTCTLLLFTASVFYPIVYGLYNRNIRKELLTCLCPTWARRRGSHVRRPSTLPSYSGSVLDFTSLRQRSALDKPERCHNPADGIAETIATISSTVGSLACPTPLMIMGENGSLPTRGYNLNLRKPSQDSGTVMVGGDDQDSDVETPAPTPRQHTTRRVSAPSVLSTVREDPHTTAICIEETPQISRHYSTNCRNLPPPQRKMTILPLSVQFLNASPVVGSTMRRSRSLDKIRSDDKEMTLDSNITYRSLRKKRAAPAVRETQFNAPPTTDRVPRRRGSVAVMKVMAIPEDCGLMEYPVVTDSGRGSVDSGSLSKNRIVSGRGSADSADLTKTFSLRCRGSVDGTDMAKIQAFKRRGSVDSTELAMARSKRQENRDSVDLGKNPATRHVSIDEGIGGDCLPEETNWE